MRGNYKGFWFVKRLLLIILVSCSSAAAADHFVRAGAIGDGSGSDWTNACTDFTGSCAVSSLVRGDTYYVADGTYSRRAFDTAESGTLVITIKKATVADHGTDVGWQDAFGDGQAIWGFRQDINTSHWVFDGITGANLSSNPNDYGFRIAQPADCANPGTAAHLFIGKENGTLTNVTVKHVAIVACGSAFDNAQNGIFVGCGSCTVDSVTIASSYVEQAGVDLDLVNTNNSLFEFLFLNGNWSSPANHGETMLASCTAGNTLRFSALIGTRGTGTLVVILSQAGCPLGPDVGIDNWEIYGNVVVDARGGNGVWAGTSDGVYANTKIFNNTHVSSGSHFFSQCNAADPKCSSAVGNVLKNNLLLDSGPLVIQNGGGPIDNDFNTYLASINGTPPTEPNGQIDTFDPFVSLPTGNFHLANGNDVSAGLALLAPFNVDLDGNTRGADGKWDRGAFDFIVIGPNAPPNLRTVVR